MASPSRVHPEYYFHWVRDSALTMDTLYNFQNTEKAHVESTLIDYVNFSRRNQLTFNFSSQSGHQIGEPKFQINGNAYDKDWGRPQNDGPALRALTLMRLANQWIASGQANRVLSLLYKPEQPATTVIKADLEYVSHHWNEPNIDLWEESYGMHFYTLISQMTAMNEGAKLAFVLGDSGAGQFYQSQAALIEKILAGFWSSRLGYYVVTQQVDSSGHVTQNLDPKPSGLDTAIILGVLHSKRVRGDFSITDPKVLSTAKALERSFASIYAINQRFTGEGLAPAIGRYPEDIYNGYDSNRSLNTIGNPWYLCTMALAEFYYKLSVQTSASANKQLYFNTAEAFLKRVQRHVPQDGSLSEQFNRDSGFAQGATHLTWSYAAFVTANAARENAKASLQIR